MKIPAKGLSETAIWERLEKFRGGDHEMDGGRMFGHAFYAGTEEKRVVEEAYNSFLWENALDPALFPSLLELEREIVAMAREHLRGPEAAGNFTSGGTESILLAVKTARDKALAEKPGLTDPEIVLPVTAHASFHKAAQYFGLKAVPAPVDLKTFKAVPDAIAKLITPRTVLVVCSAPSYAHGVIDPVPEIAKEAMDKGVLCHVDGCMGGFLLPFINKLGCPVTEIDFSVPGVTSISMDFHKYAFAAKGASMVLYRDKSIRRHQIFTGADWTGYPLINLVIQSSRSGGALAGTWAALNFIGEEGYLRLARGLMEATGEVVAGINAIDGLHVMGRPEFPLLAVGSNGLSVFEIADEMKERGWHVQVQLRHGEIPESFHLTILPANLPAIGAFFSELQDSAAAARGKPRPDLSGLVAALAGPSGSRYAPPDLSSLMKMAGVEDGKLPKRMALINELLNALPPAKRGEIFTLFYNELQS